jgi:hypothetical protein
MVDMVTVEQSPAEEKLTPVADGGDVVVEHNAVEIREEVFMQLGKPEPSHDAKVWILDTGATNHMTGTRVTFVNLGTHVPGMVCFRDDTAARIEGWGDVEFLYKNGKR